MRSLVFLPLTFMADVEGFTWFIAYAAAVGATVLVVRRIAKARANATAPLAI